MLEPVGEVGPATSRRAFDFEGTVTAEFEPTAPMTVLNTNFTTVTPKNGCPTTCRVFLQLPQRNIPRPDVQGHQPHGGDPETFEAAGTLYAGWDANA